MKKTVPEKTIVIDIKLTKGLVVALSCVLTIAALLAYLTLTGESAVASGETSPAQSTGMRQYYLTSPDFKGNEALTACADGYHFASLWEMVDPSNLKYNTSLGQTLADSGQGPMTNLAGRVRTGYNANSSTNPGYANCNAWGTTTGDGSTAYLSGAWLNDKDVGVWNVDIFSCGIDIPVWCIED